MIKYYNNHPKKFCHNVTPVFVGMMQMISALFTELMNVLLICGENNIKESVMNFIALGVIAEIDNFYASSLKNFPLKECTKDPPTILKSNKDNIEEGRSAYQHIIRFFYKTLRTFYASFYYYFMPFLAVLLSYLAVWTEKECGKIDN